MSERGCIQWGGAGMDDEQNASCVRVCVGCGRARNRAYPPRSGTKIIVGRRNIRPPKLVVCKVNSNVSLSFLVIAGPFLFQTQKETKGQAGSGDQNPGRQNQNTHLAIHTLLNPCPPVTIVFTIELWLIPTSYTVLYATYTPPPQGVDSKGWCSRPPMC